MRVSVEFLESLSDSELVFLYVYKYNGYSDVYRKQVDEMLRTRGLDSLSIHKYIDEYTFNPDNTGCPRCNSKKFLYEGTQCAICDYELTEEDTHKKSGFGKMFGFLSNVLTKKH